MNTLRYRIMRFGQSRGTFGSLRAARASIQSRGIDPCIVQELFGTVTLRAWQFDGHVQGRPLQLGGAT